MPTTPVVYGEEYAKRYIVEANGPGIAFYDYYGDGWLGIFLPNGTRLEGSPAGRNLPTLDLAKSPLGGFSRYCKYRGVPVNCGPLGLAQETCALYHNNGNGLHRRL